MQEEYIKHMIKCWIDKTDWWPKIKCDLKYIVDCSRTIGEMEQYFILYFVWLNNDWQNKILKIL